MREHPIPQDITGYKFHIIGSMTLKQFLEVAAGVVFAGILYASTLPDFLKYPFILISVSIGGMAAFVPIEERPLDHWISIFIKSMYKPTQFFWKREPHIPEVFNFTANMNTQNQEEEVNLGPVKKARIREYLTSVPSNIDPYAFSSDESSKIDNILGSFASVPTTMGTIPQTQTTQQKPQLGVRVRNFKPQPREHVVFSAEEVTEQQTTVEANKALTEQYAQRQQFLKQQKNVDQVANEIAIPELENIHVVDPTTITNNEDSGQETAVQPDNTMSYIADTQQVTTPNQDATTAASFSSNLPFPEAPTIPNKLVGMVLTPNNDLVTNAIVEVIKADGSVARAVKTNALGQFFITTPLENEIYNLVIEKDGLTFERISIKLDGTPIKPIEIRSIG